MLDEYALALERLAWQRAETQAARRLERIVAAESGPRSARHRHPLRLRWPGRSQRPRPSPDQARPDGGGISAAPC
jgi:hypothetical protein